MFLAYQDVTILEVFVIFLPWSIGSNAAGMEVAFVGLSAPYSLFPLFKMKNEKKKKLLRFEFSLLLLLLIIYDSLEIES